jgi:dolichol-phosphate mannosyltransferase
MRSTGSTIGAGSPAAGRPKYTLRKLAGLAIDGLVSFSSSPLRMVTYLGGTAAGLAMVLAVWVLDDAIRHQSAPRGWASTLVVVLFMGALQLLSLGIIGEYIRRIFLEAKQRPSYIVAELRRHDRDQRGHDRAADEPEAPALREDRRHRVGPRRVRR